MPINKDSEERRTPDTECSDADESETHFQSLISPASMADGQVQANVLAKLDELLAVVNKLRAPVTAAPAIDTSADQLHAKVDALFKQSDKIAESLVRFASDAQKNAHEHKAEVLSVKQNMETLHTVLVQHQSASEEKQGRKIDDLLQHHITSDETHARRIEALTADVARTEEILHETAGKSLTQKEEWHALLREANDDLLRGVSEIPSKVCASIEPVVTAQLADVLTKISDLRGSFSFGLESVVGRVMRTVEVEMESVKTSNATTTEAVSDQVLKSARKIEDCLQASLKENNDQLTAKLDHVTNGITNSMTQAAESSASQMLQKSSAIHETTSSNIRQQIASFQAVQLQQYVNLEKKVEKSSVDLSNVSKLAEQLVDEGVYRSRMPGSASKGR
jgi:DNA-binding phage protein